MIDFEYAAPTKVVFGRGAEQKTGSLVRAEGGHKVLVHFGTGRHLYSSGLLDRIHSSLSKCGISYVDMGGVIPNPRMHLVKEGIERCRQEGIDFILAVGGGSVIDSAKAIAYGVANDFDVDELFTGRRTTDKILPLGCVSTISASGSETSNSCVITLEDGMLKRAYNNDCARPRFAVLDPELTYTLPSYQTACGAADIMMHTMERYFTNTPDVELIDAMAEGLLVTVRDAALKALRKPDDYAARATLMWAGSLSHNGLLGTGRVTDFASHKIEHELGGMFDVAHGAGLCAVWGSWARYVYKTNVNRFAQFAVNVFQVRMNYSDPEQTALKGIEAWEDWCRRLQTPTSLRQLGIEPTDDQILEMAMKATSNDSVTIGGFLPLDAKMICDILKMAR